jgi:hypothetical protein
VAKDIFFRCALGWFVAEKRQNQPKQVKFLVWLTILILFAFAANSLERSSIRPLYQYNKR